MNTKRPASPQPSSTPPQPAPAGSPPHPPGTPSARGAQGGRSARGRATSSAARSAGSGRLFSLDAYRGFIMTLLAASGFGIHRLTQLPYDAEVWYELDYDIWQRIGFYFDHAEWVCDFQWIGVPFWDLIQPAFMFMVGVAMPFSYARRAESGHGVVRRAAHAIWRAIVLVLLGVFLSSTTSTQTNWTFVNVLCQIGLGYVFVYALLGKKFWVQALAWVSILVGYWGFFFSYAPPADYDYAAVKATEESVFEGRFAPWSKNANIAHHVDVWLLNQFPRPEDKPFEYNDGGYVTLNFIPSIATMLLGVFCGQLLHSDRRWWQKFLLLVVGGAVCAGLGVLAGQYACPIVKRIWTPSWVLLSGGWVIWMLAAFYLLFDLCRLRWLAFPLIVVGMNSIVMYLMGQLLQPWASQSVKIHFGGWLERAGGELQRAQLLGADMLADDMFGRVIGPASAFIVFWLIAWWMYRQKFFVRV